MTETALDGRRPFEIVDLDDRAAINKFIEGSFGEKMTHDKFFMRFLVDRLSARVFLETTLKRSVLRELDLDTLQIKRTRMIDVDGRECVGDLFYTVELKRKKGRRGRRAVFALILEHKSDDYVYVSIQLLGYVWAWLDYMKERRDEFADEDGNLPTPYAMVFSQEWKGKAPERIPYLHRILFWLPKMRKTVPTFWFQFVRASDIPISRIKRCEPLMRAFFYLQAFARKKKGNGSELDEIADCFENLWKIKNPDERIIAGVQACMNYLTEIKPTQPLAPTVRQVYNRVRERQGMKMDALSQFTEWFPDIITPVLVQRDEAETRRQEAETRRQEAEVRRQEAETRRQEAETRRQEAETRRQEAETRRQEAETRRQEAEALREAERRSFRRKICEKVQKKFQCEIPISLSEKLGRIDDHNALLNVFDYLGDADSLEVFEQIVDVETTNLRCGNVSN